MLAEEKARKALDEQFGIKPVAKAVEEITRFMRISEAIPLVTMTRECPICGERWTPGHALLFFLDALHHDNIIDVLKFQVGFANKVEATATRLAVTGGDNLFHEKDVVALLKEMYEKGPAAVDFAMGIVGYYVSHQREYEGTKRSVKIMLTEVLREFASLGEFYQGKVPEFRRLWGAEGPAMLEALWGEEAGADLRRIRSMVFEAEVLMHGEMEKVQELLHEDPMQFLKTMTAAAFAGAVQPQPPAPPKAA